MSKAQYEQLSLFDSSAAPGLPPDRVTSSGRGIFKVGDSVEIQTRGNLNGRRCQIIGFDGNLAICSAEGWRIQPKFELSQLKLVPDHLPKKAGHQRKNAGSSR
jgi:hypothetical protein